MNNRTSPLSEDVLAKLVFESQTTMPRTKPPTDDVFDRVRRFIRLYAQLSTKPKGAALLYQELGSPTARYRELDRELVVGRLSRSDRHPDGSDLAVEDAQMSRTHFAITCRDDFYIVRDLESRNGTYLNNDPTRIREKLLKAGDVILAGASFFVFTGAPLTPGQEAFLP
jgi:pSer/pThr/pTyr-binding forkhead associated (FHA) protein